jgi:uncharacterized phage-associated protein
MSTEKATPAERRLRTEREIAKPAAVESAFDVAFWFNDTALNNNEYLQPQKLHRLMFLAQAYYAAMHKGRRLMPAVFVASEMGPIEPNLYTAFSKGRPDMEVNLFMADGVEEFLDTIWRRFGHHSADRLTQMTKATLAYKAARKLGVRAEITLLSMFVAFSRGEDMPAIDQVFRPKVMRSQTGQPVAVKAWVPGKPAKPGS